MNRRTMVAGAISAAALGSLRPTSLFAQSTPAASNADYPDLLIVVTEDGFTVPQPLTAGRYRVTVRNDSTQPAHTGFGRLPDGARFEDFDAMGEDAMKPVNGHAFVDIEFVGQADWPAPGGGTATGVIDLQGGTYVLFDPIGPRTTIKVIVDGDAGESARPRHQVGVIRSA